MGTRNMKRPWHEKSGRETIPRSPVGGPGRLNNSWKRSEPFIRHRFGQVFWDKPLGYLHTICLCPLGPLIQQAVGTDSGAPRTTLRNTIYAHGPVSGAEIGEIVHRGEQAFSPQRERDDDGVSFIELWKTSRSVRLGTKSRSAVVFGHRQKRGLRS